MGVISSNNFIYRGEVANLETKVMSQILEAGNPEEGIPPIYQVMVSVIDPTPTPL